MDQPEKYNVLYVDDEPHNLSSFKAAFRRHYNVLTATCAKDGLDVLKNNKIHLVITDQRMPETTGVQFLESCVQEFPEMIRMILTGFSDIQDIIEAINTGRVYRYITKPWDENELKMTIDKALESYSLRIKNTSLLSEAQESELKFRSIVSNSTDLISILNADGIYTFLSPSVKDLLGYDYGELEGRNAFEFIHPEDVSTVQQAFGRALEKPGTIEAVDFRYQRKDGSYINLESRGSFQKREGKLEGIINSRDMTERVRSEQLQREKDLATESTKLKERFLANMSHEIRTPINAVMGITNLLLKTPLDEGQGKYLNAIKRSSENLLVIINDILDFSKIEAGKIDFEKIDFRPKDILDGVMDTLRFRSEEKSIELKYMLESTVPDFLVGDPVRLSQILLNLTGNAVKFTQKGSVEIFGRAKKLNEEEYQVEFSVVDTGIGIPADKTDKIFDSFSQAGADTTRKFGGTGLGLNISKQLVELQGGKISVTSVEGKGTTFTVSIKYTKGTGKGIESRAKELAKDQIEKMKSISVLLVEDNEFNRMVAVNTIESVAPGIFVDIAENGKLALEKLAKEQFDIVLMDIQMPVMDGYDATAYIRNNMKSQIPIIALTANVSQGDIAQTREAGMDDFVTKPFQEYDLMSKIYNLINTSKHPKAPTRKVTTAQNFDSAAPRQPMTAQGMAKITNLDQLISLSRGNKKYVTDMIEMFINQTKSSLQIVNESLKNGDYTKIGGIAHRMRPSFGFMGIKGMDVLTKEIEEIATSDKPKDNIPKLCEEVERVCIRAINELSEELTKQA